MKVSKLLKLILIFGVGIRVALWCFQQSPEGDDGMRYLTESVNMVEYGVFSTVSWENTIDAPTPSAHDLPLWPGIMAVVYWATDSIRATQYIAGGINIILVLGSALLLISMLREKPFSFSDKQVVLSVGVLLFMPESVMYSLCHMPDQLAVFFVMCGLWFYFRAQSLDGRYIYGAAVSFLLAIYAKPICIPLSMALLLAALFVLRGSLWRRFVLVVLSIAIIAGGLSPWVLRNKYAFGTAGLTSISGTNLYFCNWGRLVGHLPKEKRDPILEDMARFEAEVNNLDLMCRSQRMGDYARHQLLAHVPEYINYTVCTHPRLYCGTGSVAMLRYLGAERVCDALDSLWASGTCRGYELHPKEPYTILEKTIGGSLQIFSWGILILGYALVMIGIVRCCTTIVRKIKEHTCQIQGALVFLCPICCLALLAIVIGPITATRYRFIMIPFFAILSGYASMESFNRVEHME